ncbi:MAG: proline--tRNA ligase [Anaerolineae bacterium]|nr:proline--tRNA ligase [Anaerolineae bacterium]
MFGRTLRDAPGDAEMVSHQLALRAGLVRPLTAGIYAWMPLGLRVLRKVAGVIREEMEAIGGQEMLMPVFHPAEIWQRSGRWEDFGPVMLRLQNRDGRQFAVGPTHEEIVATLAVHDIGSYRDLPKLVYQIHTKYRDEARPRGGLIRLREFTMKDAYSLDRDFDGLDALYERMVQAYLNIFSRAGLSVTQIDADVGAMGGKGGHEFAMLHPQGEDRFARCDACGYAANVEVAAFAPEAGVMGALEPVQKVATPDCKTIQEVADFLGVPTRQTYKAVFYTRDETEFVFVVVRGDLEVNEIKLLNALGGGELRAATEEEIVAAGAVPGYASPLGLSVRSADQPDGITVIVDRSAMNGANFVAGANDAGYHLAGVNYPRDFTATAEVDVAEAYDGARCGRCGEGRLHIERAIEMGHVFKLGTRYSAAFGATYKDEQGLEQPIIMGSYGIGLDRLIAAIIETHHDDYGIVWPRSVAPFDVHIVTLGREETYHEQGRALHADLRRAGLDVLLDDRTEGAGVKFADADLIGVPLRLTVSNRAVGRGTVEGKWRHAAERFDIPLDGVVEAVVKLVQEA